MIGGGFLCSGLRGGVSGWGSGRGSRKEGERGRRGGGTDVHPAEHVERAVGVPHAHAAVALRVEGAAEDVLPQGSAC